MIQYFARRYAVGTVVEPRSVTTFESDDYEGDLKLYANTGKITISMITPGALLLIVGAVNDRLRVLSLASGTLGRIPAQDVREWTAC